MRVVCMETEFPDRPDGLILTETATGIELPEEQTQYSGHGRYLHRDCRQQLHIR